MHHPTDRITHKTAFLTPVVEHWLERELAQWVHSMKDRSDDPSQHERTHHGATSRSAADLAYILKRFSEMLGSVLNQPLSKILKSL